MWYLVTLLAFCPLLLLAQSPNPINNLKPDSPTQGEVTFDHWVFYRFVVPAGQGFNLNIIHTSNINHDLDVYVQSGVSLPSKTSYVYKDTMSSANITIEGTSQTTQAMYIAGLYGFKGQRTLFAITLKYATGCTKDCSGHGACYNNVCNCESGYSGDSCEKKITKTSLGITYTETVKAGQWTFYTITISRLNDLEVSVSQTSGDVDLYVKYGFIPSTQSFDYADNSKVSGNTKFSLKINQPILGVWYLGFFSESVDSTFSFQVAEKKICPMKCSGHGDCVGTRCHCAPGFSGTSCEEKTTNMVADTPASGYVDSSSWNYFRYVSDSMIPFVVQLSSRSNAEDCDIYVNPEDKPTKQQYLFRNISFVNPTEIVVYQPGQKLWFIGVFGSTNCNFTVSVHERPSNECANCVNGDCILGRCICHDGWVGDSCSDNTNNTANLLTNGVVAPSAKVANGKWVYFQFKTVNSSQVNFIVKETKSQGKLWVFVSVGHYPDLSQYDHADQRTTTSSRRVMMEYSEPKSLSYFVGVYGSPLIVSGQVEFKVVAWATPF